MYILRITFKSFQKINHLKQNLIKLQKFNKLKNRHINRIFKIKNRNKIFTVLKSPHVNKKSREHFLYKNYIRKIDLKFTNIIQLFNYLILIKKSLSENLLLQIKILKKH